MAEPRSYQEILNRGYLRGRDFDISFGDTDIARCLLVVPHGGGIEPGTSEIRRAISERGTWAWYDFAGYLRKGNHHELHLTSTLFDEPTLLELLKRTNFVLALHGAGNSRDRVVYVGGRWDTGRAAILSAINASESKHGLHAVEAPANLSGAQEDNLANRGRLGRGIQLEFSRGARNHLFPPDCSREARGRRNPHVRALAKAIHSSLEHLAAGAAAG